MNFYNIIISGPYIKMCCVIPTSQLRMSTMLLFWLLEIKKHTVVVVPNGMKFIQNFTNMGLLVEELKGGIQYTQTKWLSHKPTFFPLKKAK